MSKQLAMEFFPETFNGILKNYAPTVFDYLFPDWVAERCPMPSIDLQVPGGATVTVFWPVAAVVMVAGSVGCVVAGTRTLVRALREGAHARQGLFMWAWSMLWYACMCSGGFFFHCLHLRALPHMLDLVGTGLSSLAVIAGFAAFRGKIDDRTVPQRLVLLLLALAFIAVAVVSPPLLQEQLYVVPALLAAFVGARFLPKSSSQLRIPGLTPRQQQAHRVAHRWLQMAALAVVLGLAVVQVDKYLCVYAGVHFSTIFWFFFCLTVAIFSTHQFALVVTDHNLHFTDRKID